MRILFVPLDWPSHYYPMVPLAWACRSAGHEVRVVGEPGLLDTITRSGMPAVRVGGGYSFQQQAADYNLKADPELAKMRQEVLADINGKPPARTQKFLDIGFGLHAKMAQDMAGDLVSFARSWRPDLIIADPTVYAAPLTAEVIGVPFVRHLLGPDLLRKVGFFPGLGMDWDDGSRDGWPAQLLDVFDQFGATVRADFAVGTVDPCPPSMQIPGIPRHIPVRYVPYNGAGDMPDWLREPPTRPRISVTWSSGATLQAGPDSFPVRTVFEALADFDIEAVVTIKKSDHERVRDLPGRVRVAEELPLNLLLPTCDAAINQGSAGSLLTAAALGVPQVVIPSIADQPLNAGLFSNTGAGVALRAGAADIDSVRAAVGAVLAGRATAKAAAQRQEIVDQPTPAEVLRTLEALV